MPISRINSRPLGGVIPGPVTQALTEAFGDLAGVDIVERASRHLKE
jgi:hypothetical protein